MKKRLFKILGVAAISFIMACIVLLLFLYLITKFGTESKEQVEETNQEKMTIELSLDNVNDYIDFVSIGSSDNVNGTNDWIIINKQYENDMVIWDSDNLESLELEINYMNIDSDNEISNTIYNFETIITSIDKPIIKNTNNSTITFIKNGKAYINEEGFRQVDFEYIDEYGRKQVSPTIYNGSSGLNKYHGIRAKYFSEYPY